MPRLTPAAWLSGLVAAVPGLSVFLTGWGAPSDDRVLFSVVLEITAFGTLAVLLLRKPEIEKWNQARVGRHLVGATTGSLALIVVFAIGHKMVIHPTTWGSDDPSYVLIPIPVSVWADDAVRYEVACARQEDQSACVPPQADARITAEDVAFAISNRGEAVQIPHGLVWVTELTALLLLYSVIIATLIWLYGVAMIRRLDVGGFVAQYTRAGTAANADEGPAKAKADAAQG